VLRTFRPGDALRGAPLGEPSGMAIADKFCIILGNRIVEYQRDSTASVRLKERLTKNTLS